MKQVGRVTVITVCMIISSVGHTVPPVFSFPKVRLHASLMFGAPPGSLWLVNSPQRSWITGLLFLKVLKDVKKHTRSSKDNENRCTLLSILYARKNGVTLVTFPPHCSSITTTGCRCDGAI